MCLGAILDKLPQSEVRRREDDEHSRGCPSVSCELIRHVLNVNSFRARHNPIGDLTDQPEVLRDQLYKKKLSLGASRFFSIKNKMKDEPCTGTKL